MNCRSVRPLEMREEDTHERPPGDPPAPVEDGPVSHPARAAAGGRGGAVAIAHAAEELVRIALERDLDNVPEVVPRGLHDDVQRVPGVPHYEDREEDEVAEPEGEAAEVRDAPLQPEDHREGRDERDADDNQAL